VGTDLRYLKRLLTADSAGLLLEKFEEHRSKFEARLRKAKRRPSEDAVHNLRVASRRFLSLLNLLEAAMPALEVKSLRRTVKKGLRDLRKMRDIQVQILHSEKLLSDFPQLAPFRKALLREERRMSQRVSRRIERFGMRRFRHSTKALLANLIRSLDPDNDSALREKMGTAVEDAFRRVLSLRTHIDPKETASIHRARLAFKNFS
jgi:CHAD domain-containing protein